MQTLIISTCGYAKMNHGAPARELYTGWFTRYCLRYAEELASLLPDAKVVIMSSKYGFISPDEYIEPYDLYIGQRRGKSPEELKEQAVRGGFDKVADVRFMGGKPYLRKLVRVFPHVKPILPDGMLGSHCQALWMQQNPPITQK